MPRNLKLPNSVHIDPQMKTYTWSLESPCLKLLIILWSFDLEWVVVVALLNQEFYRFPVHWLIDGCDSTNYSKFNSEFIDAIGSVLSHTMTDVKRVKQWTKIIHTWMYFHNSMLILFNWLLSMCGINPILLLYLPKVMEVKGEI